MNAKLALTPKFFNVAIVLTLAISTLSVATARADEWGCERHHSGVVGAIIGGVIGHQFGHGLGNLAMTVAGAMVGSSIDRSIACNMERRDREEYERAMNAGLYGEYQPAPYGWQGERYQGNFIILSQGYVNRSYCREFRNEVYDSYGRLVSVRTGLMCQRGPHEWYPEEHFGWYRRY